MMATISSIIREESLRAGYPSGCERGNLESATENALASDDGMELVIAEDSLVNNARDNVEET